MAITFHRFTLSNVGDRSAIAVSDFCRKVIIREDAGDASYPSTDFILGDVAVNGAGNYIQYPAGSESLPFHPAKLEATHYIPGQVVCYGETISGSATFIRIEIP